jgi:hypothetical protein
MCFRATRNYESNSGTSHMKLYDLIQKHYRYYISYKYRPHFAFSPGPPKLWYGLAEFIIK